MTPKKEKKKFDKIDAIPKAVFSSTIQPNNNNILPKASSPYLDKLQSE